MSRLIKVDPGGGEFAEDKEFARQLRTEVLLPALADGEGVVLDFAGVTYATQSFVHTLIGEALHRHGEAALDKLEFRNCSGPLRSLIEFVVDYSLNGFAEAHPA
ncbi:MAG: STAS-like domain-containing protein [Longimicrobiaceae bacterium]